MLAGSYRAETSYTKDDMQVCTAQVAFEITLSMLISKKIREAYNLPYCSVASHNKNHQVRARWRAHVRRFLTIVNHAQKCRLLLTYTRA